MAKFVYPEVRRDESVTETMFGVEVCRENQFDRFNVCFPLFER